MKNRRFKRDEILKRKIIYFIIITVLLAICFIILMGNGKTSSYVETIQKKIYVSSGDTLWGIAQTEAVNNAYYKGKDIRYIVKDIKEINDLSNSNLYIGQELMIPSL